MAVGQLETVVAELARLRDDDDARRVVLDRASFSMLHQPALGGPLIARICASDETAPELEALTDLLGSALDAALCSCKLWSMRSRSHRGKSACPRFIGCCWQASGPGMGCPLRKFSNSPHPISRRRICPIMRTRRPCWMICSAT